MKTIVDPAKALSHGLVQIRDRFKVPASFPAEVIAAAESSAQRPPAQHVDRTAWPFVTLDPATSTDLDQAFTIDWSGNDLLLHYAIADVAWFVEDGGAIDLEAWRRGATLYLPDGKAGLYPPALSEGAASLLPDGDRPAVIFTVRVRPDGGVTLDGAERAIIRSVAKLAYDAVRSSDLPAGFSELADRIAQAEARRGATRVDPPEQEAAPGPDGVIQLRFRPRFQSEVQNAALSLATNLAVAQALQVHGAGLFRVMPEPDDGAVKRLRRTASALGLQWPRMASLAQFERTLDPNDAKQAGFMLAVRRAGTVASYAPYEPGVVPWHAAVAATYAHATAPLRRLADRYVVQATLAVATGQPVPEWVAKAFTQLPEIMATSAALGGQIERAVIDLAETVMLSGREGEVFSAVVIETDDRGARIQLCDLPVVARLSAPDAVPGAILRIQLVAADPEHPPATFRLAL